jgi:hypothetical protein
VDRTELRMLIIDSLVRILPYLEDQFLKSYNLKRTIFGGVTPYSPVEVYGGFGGNICLHLQGRYIRQARCRRHSKCIQVLFSYLMVTFKTASVV